MPRTLAGLLALIAAAGCARASLPAPDSPSIRHYAVVISGYPGDRQHADWFWGSSTWACRLLRDRYGYPPERIFFLYDDPDEGKARNAKEPDAPRRVEIRGQANRGNLDAVLSHLAREAREGDTVLLFLIGHAAFDGSSSRFSIRGGSIRDDELALLVDAVPARRIRAVLSPCQSEGFLWRLSRPGRVVIVSTRAEESNSAGVAEAGIRGFEDPACDLDGDGRLSFLEAYRSIVREQEEWYRTRGLPRREHALIDDDGDGRGHHLPEAPGAEGSAAGRAFLGDEGRPIRLLPAEAGALPAERLRAPALDLLVPAPPYR